MRFCTEASKSMPSSICCCSGRIGPSDVRGTEARAEWGLRRLKTLFWTRQKPISLRESSATGSDQNERQRKTRRGRTGNRRRRQGKAEDEEAVYVQGANVE